MRQKVSNCKDLDNDTTRFTPTSQLGTNGSRGPDLSGMSLRLAGLLRRDHNATECEIIGPQSKQDEDSDFAATCELLSNGVYTSALFLWQVIAALTSQFVKSAICLLKLHTPHHGLYVQVHVRVMVEGG